MNYIPLIGNGYRKVYIITSPKTNNVILFGNDYLLTFDEQNKLVSKTKLHQSLLKAEFDNKTGNDGKAKVFGYHTHVKKSEPYITVTDVCTLMLYARITTLKYYTVISRQYTSTWNRESNQLIITKSKH